MYAPPASPPHFRADANSAGQDALLVRLFAEFLLARQRLLNSLAPESAQPLRPALQSACHCFYELAQELLPNTPEEILVSLTKNIVLNACRVPCMAREQSDEELDPNTGRIVEMILRADD